MFATGGAYGVLFIGANGEVDACDGPGTFTSVFDTGNPGYAVKSGVVYPSGSLHTAGSSRLAFTLPKAPRRWPPPPGPWPTCSTSRWARPARRPTG